MDEPASPETRPFGFSFRYTEDEANAILESLQQAGLHEDPDWPSLLLAITNLARSAQTHATHGVHPLYATGAATQFRQLAKEMLSVATRYDRLGVDLQGLVASHMDLVLELEEGQLLSASLLPSERPALKKLLSGTRLSLLLRLLACGLDLVAKPLEVAGKAVPLPPQAMTTLAECLDVADAPPSVRKAVTQAVQSRRSPFGGRFPSSGAPPKGEAVRWAMPRLWALYETVTETPPRIYPSDYEWAPDGYDGKFYPFVKAVLAPLRVVPAESLPNAIYTAYKDHRAALKK